MPKKKLLIKTNQLKFQFVRNILNYFTMNSNLENFNLK